MNFYRNLRFFGSGEFILRMFVHFDIFPCLCNRMIYLQEYNAWIRENLDRIGVKDETVRSYFALDVEL